MTSNLFQVSATRQLPAEALNHMLEKTPEEDALYIAGNLATQATEVELALLRPAKVEELFPEWEATQVPLQLTWLAPGADGHQPDELKLVAVYPSGAVRSVLCDYQFSEEGVSFILDDITVLCDPDETGAEPDGDGIFPTFKSQAVIVGIWV